MRQSVIFLGLIIAMIGDVTAEAYSPERTAVRVQCTSATLPERDLRILCEELVQSLATIVPRAAYRQVMPEEWQPYGETDVSVRLEMSGTVGKLLWKTGPNGAVHTGSDHPLDLTLPAPAQKIRRFIDGLLASTPRIVAALHAASSTQKAK